MSGLEGIRSALPEYAKDIKLNLQTVVQVGTLSAEQVWGTVVTSAAASREPGLLAAMVDEAKQHVAPAVVEDALAAATMMGMNNVYYRFRHFMEHKSAYEEKPARLRMNRIVKPATNKVDFELFSLAASAINGCEMCVRAHEKVVVEGGITEDGVHDAVRIAATVNAAAVALSIGNVDTAEAAQDASASASA